MKGQRRYQRVLRHPRLGTLRFRSGATVAGLVALAVGLGGCLAIKTQSTSQRVPGVIKLLISVCASDRDRSVYVDCDAANPGQNTAETDNGQEAADDVDGQVLAGFRVPAGTIAPEGFSSDTGDVFFSRRDDYTAELNEQFPLPESQRWFGYVSTPKRFDLDQPALRQTSFAPEFILPTADSGEPFAGPFPWRAVVGLRPGTDANAPVDCTGIPAVCFDSPPIAAVPDNLSATVSDFGVLSGGSTLAGHGETAVVSFPLKYVDNNAKGPQVFSISATTNLPGSSATPSVTTVGATPNSTNTVNVAVPVPPGTPLGAYSVTLTAGVGTPAVTRSNTATINVVDKIAPSIRISVPAEGRTLRVGQSVVADYGCSEESNGSGVRSCAGPVASGARIDTRSVGTKSFTVAASDHAGNTASLTRAYRVALRPPRKFSLSREFAAFARFTTFSSMEVKDFPRGSTVKATCKGGSRRCPGKARKALTKRGARGVVSLNKRYKGVRLKAGTKITVRVSTPGFITAAKVLTVRGGKRPKVVDRCVRPGSTRLRRSC